MMAVLKSERPLRPTTEDYHEIEFSDEMPALVMRCWDEDPA
jgi:hypothetical protein